MGLIQSRFVQSPLIHGGGALKAAAAPPASFIFNGSNERLSTVLSVSSPTLTSFTVSFWARQAAAGRDVMVTNPGNGGTAIFFDDSDDSINADNAPGNGDWFEFADGLTIPLNTWEHWVVRFDSTQGTQDNRLRFYQNGTLLSDSTVEDVGSNEASDLFVNGVDLLIGAGATDFFSGRLAFVDVLDGVSAAPTDFAFSDGGTWTRIPYAGSYGNNGFGIDGSDGFNTTAGQSFAFTGNNMTVGDNLDFEELPPFTS